MFTELWSHESTELQTNILHYPHGYWKYVCDASYISPGQAHTIFKQWGVNRDKWPERRNTYMEVFESWLNNHGISLLEVTLKLYIRVREIVQELR